MLFVLLKRQLEPNDKEPKIPIQPWTACHWAPKTRMANCSLSGSRSAASGTHDSSSFTAVENSVLLPLHAPETASSSFLGPLQAALPSLAHHNFLSHQESWILALYLWQTSGQQPHRPLGITKTHGDLENKVWTHNPCLFQSEKDSGSSPRPRPVRVLLPYFVDTLGVRFGGREWVPRLW